MRRLVSRLVLKRRGSLDLRYAIGRWDVAGGATIGRERDAGETINVRGYDARLDYLVIPQKLTALLQYDLWRDGLVQTRDDGVITAGLSYTPLDQVTLRLVGLVSDATLSGENKDDKRFGEEAFLTQFVGKTIADSLTVGTDVTPVAGGGRRVADVRERDSQSAVDRSGRVLQAVGRSCGEEAGDETKPLEVDRTGPDRDRRAVHRGVVSL